MRLLNAYLTEHASITVVNKYSDHNYLDVQDGLLSKEVSDPSSLMDIFRKFDLFALYIDRDKSDVQLYFVYRERLDHAF